jgi:hypothetical protein
MAPPPVDSQPGHEEVPVTRAARAREVSVLGAVALYAFFLALVAVILVSALEPPDSPWGSALTQASRKSGDASAARLSVTAEHNSPKRN